VPYPSLRLPRSVSLLLAALCALAAIIVAALAVPVTGAASAASSRTLNVAKTGSAKGDGSVAKPLSTITAALKLAQPGDTIAVAPGVYQEFLKTVRAGTATAPIRITGAPGARIKGKGVKSDDRLIQIMHSNIVLQGFEISDAGKLVWIQQATGVGLLGNNLHDAAGECVRVKYLASGNEIAGNTIARCGMVGFGGGKKNGEGIYIGTAPEQLSKNPTKVTDRSDANWVHDNRINPRAECVDVKEGARDNLIEGNTCWGNLDPDSGAFESRGEHAIFRHNVARDGLGAGIRLGGDTAADGLRNDVYGNTLTNFKGYGIKVMRPVQGKICGNTVVAAKGGISNDAAAKLVATVACG
jgi:hypothetical protein